jgi:hypothetical protein
MSYKIYTENIVLAPRETKVVKFPWGYFKRSPTVSLTSTSNVNMSTEEVTKNYFVITNPISQKIVLSYSAILKRDQKVLKVYSDIDGDSIPDINDPDIDGDAFSNVIEISAGTDPFDPQDFPTGIPSFLYIGLTTPAQTNTAVVLSFYLGEMNDLTYPTLVNLQPDSNNNTQYEILTNTIETQRVRNSNSNVYNNTTPISAIVRIDSLEQNKNYKLFSIASYDSNNPPEINAVFKSSFSNSENSHSFLSGITSDKNLIEFSDTNVSGPQYWIHNVNISNTNQVTFTPGSQQEAPFAYSGNPSLLFHTQYTSNSNGSSPDLEIAVQQASFSGSDDGSLGYAGYINNYTFEEVNNVYPLSAVTVNNYTSINTELSSDVNVENHARVVANMLLPRTRYRMHVKLANGTDCDFKIALNVGSMTNFSDLATYNANYDATSNLDYYTIIPDDDQTNARTYYHYFAIREDGFIIWENNLTING